MSLSSLPASAARPPDPQYRMTVLSRLKFLSWLGNSGSARNSSMPRETCTAPATLPLFSTSGASRTSDHQRVALRDHLARLSRRYLRHRGVGCLHQLLDACGHLGLLNWLLGKGEN